MSTATQTKNLYEGMYIISATLSEKARKDALDKITDEIVQKGGEILKIHDLGRKKFTYEMEGHREGYYFVVYFTVNPVEISGMWKGYRLNEDLIRFVTFRTDKVMEKIEFKPLESE